MKQGIQIIDPQERFKVSLEGAAFHLRRLDSATLTAIERRHKADQSPAGRQAMSEDALDYIVLDWEGVGSSLGEGDVPCTRENKQRLPTAIKLRLLAAAQRNRAEDSQEP